MAERPDLAGLPGAELVTTGLRDLERRRLSAEALCLAQASRRLRQLGLDVPVLPDDLREPELALYETLRSRKAPHFDPYFAYNALRRELDSFMACLESRRRRVDDGDP